MLEPFLSVTTLLLLEFLPYSNVPYFETLKYWLIVESNVPFSFAATNSASISSKEALAALKVASFVIS